MEDEDLTSNLLRIILASTVAIGGSFCAPHFKGCWSSYILNAYVTY